MATLITEPLRAEHRELIPRLDALRALATEIEPWQPATHPDRIDAVVWTCESALVPHALAEESALYPVVEEAMGAPGAMATMVADHREIARRINALASTATALRRRDPRPDEIEDLRAQLYGLWAILLLHFEKEEDVLLPILDGFLDAARASEVFAAMHAKEHEGASPGAG